MIEKLFIDFFKEIELKQFKENKNSKAEYWASELQEVDFNHENYIGKRKAERYYEKYIEGRKNVSVKIPNEYQRNFMSNYLGYEDYEDFIIKNEGTTKPPVTDEAYIEKLENNLESQKKEINDPHDDKPITITTNNWKKTFTVSISLFITLCTAIAIIENHFFNSDDCIIWKIDHYEKSSYFITGAIDNTKHKININLFKKVAVDTNTVFFTDGKPNYWYGKNHKGKREFFTHRGIHPQTKRELNPITRKILDSENLLNE